MKTLTFVISMNESAKMALRAIDCTKADLSYRPTFRGVQTHKDLEIVAKQCEIVGSHNARKADLQNQLSAFNPHIVTLTGRSKAAIVENFSRFASKFDGKIANPVYSK